MGTNVKGPSEMEIVQSWASNGAIDDVEAEKLGLTRTETEALNSALKDCVITEDEAKALPIKWSNSLGQWKPIEAYLNWLDAGNVKDVNEPLLWRFVSYMENRHLYEDGKNGLPKDIADHFIKTYTSISDIQSPEEGLGFIGDIASAFGESAESLISPLFDTVLDRDEPHDALRGLAAIGSSALEYMLKMLDNKDPAVRSSAMTVIGEMKCETLPKAYEKIAWMADNDPESAVRAKAAELRDGTIFICRNEDKESFFSPSKIHTDQESIERLREQGIDMADHPMLGIIHHMPDWSSIDDLRSAGVFMETAQSMELREMLGQRRDITILYPASGSHIASLLIPFKLIDDGRLDRARLVYTEINPHSLPSIERYLGWYQDQGIISGITTSKRGFADGEETAIKFSYQGKPIELLFALNVEGGELYAHDDYIRQADLVVFHDGIYDIEDGQAGKFIQKMEGFKDKRRLVLAEWSTWKLPKDVSRGVITGREFSYRYIEGPYGCIGNIRMHLSSERVIDGKIVEDRRSYPNRKNPYHLKNMSHGKLDDGAVLIKVE